VAVQAAEVVTIPMAENARGNMSADALYVLREKWRGCGAVAVGPGLSRDSDCLPVLTGILRECQVPVVLDADALNLLALSPGILQARRAPTVLTPHPGEAARLLACTTAEIQADRPKAARCLAERFSSTVVLKGAHTLVAGTDGMLSLNVTGNSGMATAGSGDVLTGLLAALLARGLGTYDAARLAVFLHGLAGDLAAATSGEDGLVAGDILAEIPKAYLELKKINM
jgi:NAD(P)H-hydrate epimerase